MNINRILFFLIAVLSIQQTCVSSLDLEDLQGLTPAQKRSAFELVDSLSSSLVVSVDKPKMESRRQVESLYGRG